jgi:S-adenosylmethionine:tRNA ribosyltransferase-isomerase
MDKQLLYRLSSYDYKLPKELIAQEPLPQREGARLLILNRHTGEIIHSEFSHIVDYLNKNDVLVINDTKVIPARLFGKKESGGKIEVLFLPPKSINKKDQVVTTFALLKTSHAPKSGQFIYFNDNLKAEVLGYKEEKAILRFYSKNTFLKEVLEIGHVPLPPYIKRKDEIKDRGNYQTIYATKQGAIAAPTAGIHFSPDLIEMLKKKAIEIVPLTLHVSYGTFIPVKVDDIRTHKMHGEYYEVTQEAAHRLEKARKLGRRIIAVGTTSTRLLEYLMSKYSEIHSAKGICDLFIYPGYKFKIVKAMISNFHLPKSTLIMLVSAFAGRELILKTYQEAIEKRYRFYSYGDAMFIF